MNYLFGRNPNFKEFSKLVEAQFSSIPLMELFMKFSSFSSLRLDNQIFLNQILDCLAISNAGNVLSDIDHRSYEFELVYKKLRKNELHFRIEISNLQSIKVLLFELSYYISIVRHHSLQESKIDHRKSY
jgi:hypothetical protein